MSHCAEHTALHFDHAQGRRMVGGIGRAAAVFEQHALEAAVIGFAHGGVHADIGGNAGQDQVVDAACAQDQFQIGGAEGAFGSVIHLTVWHGCCSVVLQARSTNALGKPAVRGVPI